jgi:hypothetical protein
MTHLLNEPAYSHFYCITFCLFAHCLFGRFFLAFFALYSGGSDAHTRGESSPLSLQSLSCVLKSAQASRQRVPEPRRSVWSHLEMKGKETIWRQASHLFYRKWGV